MIIVIFAMSMNKGGAEHVISTLCNYGVEKNHEMHIVTCLRGDFAYELNQKVIKHDGFITYKEYRSRHKLATLPKLCNRYIAQMRKIDPDMIVSFLPEPCMITELCKNKVGKPIIGAERSNPYFQYRSFVYKTLVEFLYPRSDGFVFQTDGAKEFFRKKLKEKSIVIGNPISISDSMAEISTPKNRNKEIVSVGRFVYQKNYPLLVKAFRRVVEKKPDYVLKIYGKIDEALGIRRLCEELGVSDHVIFMGQTDHVEEEICNAAVFVLSSISEGMPNALMEAMALGMPVVATDCPSGGPRQLITDGENGLLVRNNDEAALAEGILKILDDEGLAKELSMNAKKIVDEYSTEKICEQWMRYIEKVYLLRTATKR